MGAPGPLSAGPSNITEWLPLLGSIVQALCGTSGEASAEDAREASAGQRQSQDRSEETGG